MGQTRSKGNGSGNHNGNGGATRRAKRAGAGQADVGSAELKHLAHPPGGYLDIARQFAHALGETGFRAPVSAAKMRSLIAQGERLSQRAGTLQTKATMANRQRMVHDARLWKAMLDTWRMVSAAMPVRPELEGPFAFMQAYMSVSRSQPVTPPAPPASSPPATPSV